MKFEFCGKLDCPDWLLAQLYHASSLDTTRFKLICEGVKDTILANGQFDEELFDKLDLDDQLFDIDDARACFAAVNYIVTNACLSHVQEPTLWLELEQLGLPGEHCRLICSLMDDTDAWNELRKRLI